MKNQCSLLCCCCCCCLPLFRSIFFYLCVAMNIKNRNKVGDFFTTIKFHTIKSTMFFFVATLVQLTKKSSYCENVDPLLNKRIYRWKMWKWWKKWIVDLFKLQSLCCLFWMHFYVQRLEFDNSSIHNHPNLLETPLLTLLSFGKCFLYQYRNVLLFFHPDINCIIVMKATNAVCKNT